MTDFEKAAILGATGPTGRHLAPLLQERTKQVRAISRSESNLRKCFPDETIEKVAADATDEAETVRALDGCDVVYDCIGLPGDLIAQHPVTARNIAKAIRQTGTRCVQVSSYWAYLPIVKLPLTEEHPRTDGPVWSRYRREAEDILQDAGACVLHLPDFYGPYVHTSTMQNTLIDVINDRPMNWIGAADVDHELIYVADAMRIAAEIATHDEAYAQRYVLPGSGAVTGAEVAHLAGGKLRAASPTVLRIVSLFDKNLRSFMPMVPHYAKTITYDASKLHALIGTPKMTSYADGIQETLDSLRDSRR
ncbi:MAG: NAD-dependent epimerase/dehydratase family protein [Acidobacteriota bacterium]|nr:MAG: NAD-dependent epimerase/dehydratase family protein [Acidobacteriota bacterium]